MPQESPAFSNFRALLDLWDETANREKEEKLKSLFKANDLIFFFRMNREVFGASEDGRMTFATMRDPQDEGEDWVKEASFTAFNLKKLLNDDPSAVTIINYETMPKLKIIDEKSAIKDLT